MGVAFTPVATPQSQRQSRGLCWGCNYSLRGLIESRCPECGRSFDEKDPTSMNFGASGPMARFLRKTWRICKPILVLGVCVGFCWLMYLGTEGQLPPLLLLPAIYLAVRRRWALLAVFLLFTPFFFAFAYYASEFRAGSSIYVYRSRSIV